MACKCSYFIQRIQFHYVWRDSKYTKVRKMRKGNTYLWKLRKTRPWTNFPYKYYWKSSTFVIFSLYFLLYTDNSAILKKVYLQAFVIIICFNNILSQERNYKNDVLKSSFNNMLRNIYGINLWRYLRVEC